MNPCPRLFLAAALAVSAAATAGIDPPPVPIHFKKGTTGTVVSGTLKGGHGVDYTVAARAGQTLTVDFTPSNLSAYFNLLPPGSNDEALFVGSTSGNRYEGTLLADGVYTLRVYLMRNAARRNESSKYRLAVSVKDAPAGTAP